MDKKSIIGIVVVGLLFLGFLHLNGREQKRYEAEMAQWQAYQDSVTPPSVRQCLPIRQPLVAAENAGDASATVTIAAFASSWETKTCLESLVGPSLAAASRGANEEFTIENYVMAVRFDARRSGHRRDAQRVHRMLPRGERHEPVELFDPATARFE